MANTYSELYVQIVFAVQNRHNLISESFREELQKYICGIIKKDRCKPYSIYCNPDHTHVLIGIRPSISISDLARDIKGVSSRFINDRKVLPCHFQWQDGFGAFSYAPSDIDNVSRYILNQPEHHKRQAFKEEYISLLNEWEIEYDEKYLFDWL